MIDECTEYTHQSLHVSKYTNKFKHCSSHAELSCEQCLDYNHHFAPVERLAEKIVFEMTHNVSSEILNHTQQLSTLASTVAEITR